LISESQGTYVLTELVIETAIPYENDPFITGSQADDKRASA